MIRPSSVPRPLTNSLWRTSSPTAVPKAKPPTRQEKLTLQVEYSQRTIKQILQEDGIVEALGKLFRLIVQPLIDGLVTIKTRALRKGVRAMATATTIDTRKPRVELKDRTITIDVDHLAPEKKQEFLGLLLFELTNLYQTQKRDYLVKLGKSDLAGKVALTQSMEKRSAELLKRFSEAERKQRLKGVNIFKKLLAKDQEWKVHLDTSGHTEALESLIAAVS